jgi:hypothetical protein
MRPGFVDMNLPVLDLIVSSYSLTTRREGSCDKSRKTAPRVADELRLEIVV